jgi:hypothetical protein
MPADGGACNALLAPTSVVTQTCKGTQAAPTPQGGTIHDGLYVLTASSVYGSCSELYQVSTAWAVCGESWQTHQEFTMLEGGTAGSTIMDLTATTASVSAVSWHYTCGLLQPDIVVGYDATPTTLTLYVNGAGSSQATFVDTLTRQ